jgi:hypothetical protein
VLNDCDVMNHKTSGLRICILCLRLDLTVQVNLRAGLQAGRRWQPERSYEPIIMLGLLTVVAVTAGLGHYDTVAFDHELSSSTPFT